MIGGNSEDRAIERALADKAIDRGSSCRLRCTWPSAAIPRGILVLRGFVAGGEVDGLTAYSALRRLQKDSPPPPGLATLLSTAELVVRYAVVEVLAELPPALALPLFAAGQPRSRQRRGDESWPSRRALSQQQAGGFVEILLGLRGDPDVIVRAYAAQLAELGPQTLRSIGRRRPSRARPQPTEREQPAGSPKAESGVRADGGDPGPVAVPAASGQLFLDGEELVRAQIDRSPSSIVSDKPITLPPGRHVLRYLGGQQEFTLGSGQTLRLRIPVRLSDQLLADGREALGRNDLDRAKIIWSACVACCSAAGDRSRRPCKPMSRSSWRSCMRPAAGCASRCPSSIAVGDSAGQRRPELAAALSAMQTRMAGRAGQFRSSRGRWTLRHDAELWLPPGEQISIGRGQTRSVFRRSAAPPS